jgi:hypothetical protein
LASTTRSIVSLTDAGVARSVAAYRASRRLSQSPRTEKGSVPRIDAF